MRSGSLALKLTVAFLLAGLTGAALVAMFSWWATMNEFGQLVLEQARSEFVSAVSFYYEINGSWEGVLERLPILLGAKPAQRQPLLGETPLPQPRQPQPDTVSSPQQGYVFALADLDGVIVVPAGRYSLGTRVPMGDLEEGEPVLVNGSFVGTVLAIGEPPSLGPREENYLARTNRSFLYAALGATAIALPLGVFLIRNLIQPLREMTAAAQAMAQGELGQQVPVRSQDELGELAAAFNQMSADLARANQSRRQMTADIAHDLRTPLTVIAGYLESLREGVLEPSPERFEVMYQESRHLQRLVEDLRTLSLADAGRLGLNRYLVSPLALLEQAEAAHRPQALQQQVTLQVQTSPDLPEIDVDPDRIAQVLGNLLNNALRHTPEGGRIVLSAQARAGQVRLIVRDNGEGIAPEALPRLFDRFYRVDESRQAHEEESGLGLAIAKSLVELHGGTIAVESVLGEGTVFTVSLPSSYTTPPAGK